MPVTVRTACALCESRCGVVVDVEDHRVVAIRPDEDHPVSKGHACVKGLQFHTVHHSERRVRQPLIGARGSLEAASWPDALSHLGARLKTVIDEHGADAVGLYSGNAAGHSLGAVLGVAALQRGIGTKRHYSCLTLDNSPQFVVYEEVFGAAMRTFAADYARSDSILLIGTDPLSSQCSQAQSNPRGLQHLHQAGRDGRLWVVDPRQSKTAAAGKHLAVRPGSDIVLLAWLLRDALDTYRSIPEARGEDLAALREAVDRFDLEVVIEATGASEGGLIKMRNDLFSAERPILWVGLGVLLGGHGTLGFWLAVCVNAALGSLGRPGGWVVPPTAMDIGQLARRLGLKGRDPDVVGRSGHPAIMDTLAAADLSEDALAGDLRALVVVGGNPLLALPDHARARQALESLDLLICLDLFTNDTGVLADAVLPVASWLARDDLPLHLLGQRWADGEDVRLSLEPAATSPVGESRPDLDILSDLCRAAGCRPFGSRALDLALRTGLEPARIADWLLPTLPRASSPPLSLHADHLLRLAVPDFIEALSEVQVTEPALRLISSVRPVETLNHWMHDSRAARRRESVASAHPDSIAKEGVSEGLVRIERADGRSDQYVIVHLNADPTLRRGVVVLPFGWGHLAGAAEEGGVSVNRLSSSSDLEAFTGQPRSNGIAVRLRVVDVP